MANDFSYKPSDKYNLPVIGKITTKLIGVTVKGNPVDSEQDEFDVIKVLDNEDGSKTYMCNSWYKEGVPQLVHQMFVIKYEEK